MINELQPGQILCLPSGRRVRVTSRGQWDEWRCIYVRTGARVCFTGRFLMSWARREVAHA